MSMSSCGADHTDVSGTYVGQGTGTLRPKDGTAKDFTVPNDAVIVKMTSRHYQFSEIDVTVRGCTLRTMEGGGETSWPLGRGGGACTFDIPGVGAVPIRASGGLQRNPPSRSSRPINVNLSLYGSTESGDSFSYTIEAKPKK
jgi:hypothetical protein